MEDLNAQRQKAAQAVRSGGVIAYPTEYCFGLGCDPANDAAVERVLELKQRSRDQGVLLVAADIAQLHAVLHPDVFGARRALLDEAESTWPGPVSWVLPAHPDLSRWVRGTRDTVGVRVTALPVTRDLCIACGSAIVSTSANRHGEPPARTPGEVVEQFGDAIDVVMDAPVGDALAPSELRVAGTGEVLRAGSTS